MHFGHFIVGHVQYFITFISQVINNRVALRVAFAELDANKDVRINGVGVTVVEFGDSPLTDSAAEFSETTRLLGYRNGEQSLPLFP